MRAAIYARLSAKSEDQDNVPQQLERGREVVERRGWTPAGEYVDDGISAWKDDATRPAFQGLLEACREGEVDVIVVRDVDRLTRNPWDWGDLAKTRVEVATHSGELLDRVFIGILASLAERESDWKSQRQKLAEERRVARGAPPRGGRHFGYELGYGAVVEDEAEALREMAERWLGGEPLRALARELDERGFTTTRGNEWTNRALKKTLQSPTLAAIRVHKGVEHLGAWEPIFTRELHARLRAADEGRARRRAPERYLLTGLLFCGNCGDQLNGKKHTKTSTRYSCRGCHRVGMAAEPVEAHLWNEALARTWKRDKGAQAKARRKVDEVERELTVRRGALEELEEAYWQARAVPKETYYEQAPRLREAVADLETELEHLRDEAGRAEGYWANLIALATEHDEASQLTRRRIVERALVRVTVAPTTRGAGRLDLDRLDVEWRE